MTGIIKTTGRNIKLLRVSKGISQITLAKKIPMAQAFLSRIERGVQEPSLEMLGRIAKALGCDTSDLTKGTEQENDTIKALVPVVQEQSKEQNIIIERQEGNITIRYILPPTAETYEFLAEQLNKPSLAEQIDFPDKAVVVTNSGHHNRNNNKINIGTKKVI